MSTTAPGICLSRIACWMIASTVEKRADAGVGLASVDHVAGTLPPTRTVTAITKAVTRCLRWKTIEKAHPGAWPDRLIAAINDESLSCFLKIRYLDFTQGG